MRTPSRSTRRDERHRPSRLLAALVLLAVFAVPAVAFSADTVIGTVPVGDSPVAVSVDPVTHSVYVANFYGDSVTVIDGVSHAVEATVPMAARTSVGYPIAVVADPLSGKAYAGNFWSGYVSVIGPAHSAVATISPPLSHSSGIRALALDLSGPAAKVYAAVLGKDLVAVIDGATDSVVATIGVGSAPRAIATFASGLRRRVFVANRYTNDVSIIDGATDSVIGTAPTGAGPKAIAVDPNRGFAYVSSPASDTVTVIDDNDAATATISVGDNPIGIAVDAARRRVFVADYLQNAVTVIDADTLSVVGTVNTDVQPYAVAVDQSAGKVFVTCYGGDSVTVIDAATLAAVNVPAGGNPYALAVDEGLAVHKTFVGNWNTNDLSIIDPAEGSGGPVTVAVDRLAGDTTAAVSPVLTGTATSTRAPMASAVVAVFYRLDSDPVWRRAEITQGAGTPAVRWSASVGTLAAGAHVVHVAAMDQALAAASSCDQGSGGASAALGSPSAYAFSVGPAALPVTGIVVSPPAPDGDAGWYVTTPTVTLLPDQPVPTYYGWDGDASSLYAAPIAAPLGVHDLAYLSGDEAHGFEETASLTLSFDPVIPSGPILSDVSHLPGVWSKDATITLAVSDVHDANSGLSGMAATWAENGSAVPDGPYAIGPLASSIETRVTDGEWYAAIRARDVAGNRGAVVRSGPYLVDSTPPITAARVTRRLGSAEVSLDATDALSGVDATRYRVDGGQWVEGTTITLGPGYHEVAFASVDIAGNEESEGGTTVVVVGRYEETDTALVRSGRWNTLSDSRLSRGKAIWTDRRGAYVEMTFTGTSVDWISPTGPSYGVARVTVDAAPPILVDLYTGAATYGRAVWSVSGLSRGVHTVRIECAGMRTKPSRGSRIALDALDIDGNAAMGAGVQSRLDMRGIRLYTRQAN